MESESNVSELQALLRRVLEELPEMLETKTKTQTKTVREVLAETDGRLVDYIDGVISEGERWHNLYEVLAVRKFLRLLTNYEWRAMEVQRFFRFYEKLKFNGLDGRRCYKLTPVQCFQFASIYGFYREDGTRLVREAVLLVPRKFGKSTACSALVVADLLYGDANGQAYLAANSQDQANICYSEAKRIIEQLDPDGNNFRVTASETNWKTPNKFGKESKVARLTAGAKTKDGLNCSVVVYDEYMSARYVKDQSDGAQLLQVLTSSMGARREPLTIIISTASRVVGGPGEILLNSAKQALVDEAMLDADALRAGAGRWDYQFLSCFQPHPWQLQNESEYGNPDVWRMCQPHLGVTVQKDFYAEEWVKAQQDPEKYKEFLCKYLNIFQTDKVKDWITPEQIRRLQVDYDISALSPKEWLCWIGCDFSKGDDMCIMSYNCYNPKTKQFFWDCAAWVAREQMVKHPNHVLFEQWASDGWLNVCEGAVINKEAVLGELERVNGCVNIVSIGYDPYDSLEFVNLFQTWMAGKLRGRVWGKALDKYIKERILPVSQTWGSFNASTQVMWQLVNMPERCVSVSPSPIIPFSFGCAVLELDKYDNCKPVKRGAHGSGSNIDVVIGLLEGVILQNK